MKQIADKLKCTGCQTCRLLCPNNCISMTQDGEGFLVPFVDEASCADCGLCASRCPENNLPAFINTEQPLRVIGARLKDNEFLSKSASGGVFVGLAARVFKVVGLSRHFFQILNGIRCFG